MEPDMARKIRCAGVAESFQHPPRLSILMKRGVVLLFLMFVGCDAGATSPSCSTWLRCYDACSQRAVQDLDDELVVECDRACREDLDYLADADTPEASFAVGGFGSHTRVVGAERLAIQEEERALQFQVEDYCSAMQPREAAVAALQVAIRNRAHCNAKEEVLDD